MTGQIRQVMICPHTLYQLHLTKVPETPLDTFERRIGVILLFDNIPLGLADRFAKSEKGLPVNVAFSNKSFFVRLAEFFYVYGDGPARVLVEVWKRVRAAVYCVSHIDLHNHILARVPVEGVPEKLTVHCCEFDIISLRNLNHPVDFS